MLPQLCNVRSAAEKRVMECRASRRNVRGERCRWRSDDAEKCSAQLQVCPCPHQGIHLHNNNAGSCAGWQGVEMPLKVMKTSLIRPKIALLKGHLRWRNPGLEGALHNCTTAGVYLSTPRDTTAQLQCRQLCTEPPVRMGSTDLRILLRTPVRASLPAHRGM